MKWAYAWAMQPGPGKEISQDYPTLQVHGDYLAMAVCDGAGSAPNSAIGSRVAAITFCKAAAQWALVPVGGGEALDPEAIGREWANRMLATTREEIANISTQDNQLFNSYATTLVGVLAGPEGTLFVQIGDGAAIYSLDGTRHTALLPEEAEFLNTTFFVTDEEAEAHLQIRYVEGAVDEIALFTDGISGLVLHPGTQEPHDRFFETVFRNVRAEEGQDQAASAWLADMLKSDFVTSRSDDDTSIVVARRG